jgi:hypothetical protein
LDLRDFVLVKLEDPKLYHVWMGRVENEVVKDEQSDNFRHVHLQTSMVGAVEKRSKE